MTDLVLSLLVLAGVILTGGAWFVQRRGDGRRAVLMLIAGLVMFANVAIWLMPAPA